MLITIVGAKNCGKSTASLYFQNKGFHPESFANPVKDTCAAVFNWDREMLEGATKESRVWREIPDEYWSNKLGYSFTPRRGLEIIGTDLFRDNFRKDIWLLSFENRILSKPNVVVSDGRMMNEIEFTKSIGGKVIKIIRGELPWYENLALEAVEGNIKSKNKLIENKIYQTEYEWLAIKADYNIENNDTLEKFNTKIENVFNRIMETEECLS